MAKKFDLDGTSVENVTPEAPMQIESPTVETPFVNVEDPEDAVHGLNQEEIKDPNSIVVSIADQAVPIIVLFGPTECGKTMTLIRMTRFLQKYGYRVSPIRSFRPSADAHYAQMCEGYNELVHSSNAAEGTQMISFMLVEVLDKNGRRICQILEAPGEYYYNPKKPGNDFPAYVQTIIHSNNRKIWIYMVEPDWKDPSDRSGYVSKLQKLKTMMRPQDRAIFLYNKVDKSNFVISPGHVNMPGIKNDIENMYPGIFTPFVNLNPITKWFKPYLCDLVPFSNGSFTRASKADGTAYLTYQQGVDEYPQMLWNYIMKRIRG
ncbi:MAG: hypothetical protein J5939_07040 [Bacteroidales bacterium]|nr:hypothetical protein [Bacteroidales bacterium]